MAWYPPLKSRDDSTRNPFVRNISRPIFSISPRTTERNESRDGKLVCRRKIRVGKRMEVEEEGEEQRKESTLITVFRADRFRIDPLERLNTRPREFTA